jgi:hypothetical protein
VASGISPGSAVGAPVTERFYQRDVAISSSLVTADPTHADVPSGSPPGLEPGPWRRSRIRTVLLAGLIVAFVAFWTWALFFASKEAVNKIGDREWAARAESICADYDVEIRALETQRSPDLDVRAGLVVQSTDLLAAMLDEVVAVPPSDEKGQAIVPAWEADYRTLLADRYRYAEQLRAGENVAFSETAVEGVPITERIETFAGDNEMPSCRPPRGSVI